MYAYALATSVLAVALSLLLATQHIWRPTQVSQCGYQYDASLRNHLISFCPNQGLLSRDVRALETAELAMPDDDVEHGVGGATLVSLNESFGFFKEPNDQWKLRKKQHRMELGRQKRHAPAFHQCQLAAAFWGLNYRPSFSCAYKQLIGGDEVGLGMYAVCDPHKISQKVAGTRRRPTSTHDPSNKPTRNAGVKEGCLVYSVGSDGDFSFEESVRAEISAECEIHTFDPNPVQHYNGENASAPDFVSYHAYPVGTDMGSRVGAAQQDSPGKSMPDIVSELGHEGRTIDLFKIDCEGCEFETYESWFGSNVIIQQILIELHWDHCDRDMVHKVQKFFQYLQNQGYVAFNREPAIVWNPEAPGSNMDYSFIRLGSNFAEV